MADHVSEPTIIAQLILAREAAFAEAAALLSRWHSKPNEDQADTNRAYATGARDTARDGNSARHSVGRS